MVRRQQSFWNFNTESCNYSNFAVRYVYLQTCYQMTHPWAKLICTVFCDNREKCDESISINTWNCKSRVWFHWPQLETTTKLNSCFVTLTGDTCFAIQNIQFPKKLSPKENRKHFCPADISSDTEHEKGTLASRHTLWSENWRSRKPWDTVVWKIKKSF